VSCLLWSTQGWDLKGFLLWERDKLRKGGPHATEGVRYTLARFSSVMYGIVLGVTPPDTLRKMNSDNNAYSTLISNIMNEYDYVWLWYAVRHVQVYASRTSYEVIPTTILGFPDRPV